MNEDKILGFMRRPRPDMSDTPPVMTLDQKSRFLEKQKKSACNECISKIFEKFYQQAVPLNPEYKNAYNSELSSDMDDFAKGRGAVDLAYYVGEANRKKISPCATRIVEGVNHIVNQYYENVSNNLHSPEITADDMVFRMDDATEERLDALSKDCELDNLADAISDQVKADAMSEISRAKAEKEAIQQAEEELANDMSVNDETAIESALMRRGLIRPTATIYQPSLFEGIMIGKTKHHVMMQEAGYNNQVYLYDTLLEYGKSSTEIGGAIRYATAEEMAFVESVRLNTCIYIARALNLEKFSLPEIRDMAMSYSAL